MFRFINTDVWVGSQVKRFKIVDHPGAAAIWAVDNGRLLLVEQYRPAAHRYTLEIPAGTIEFGEEPLDTARREFEEETGYKADEYQSMGHIYPSPGYTTEVLHLFTAQGLKEGVQHLEEGEDLTVRWIALEDVRTMVKSGEINDAKTLVAYYKYMEAQG